MIYYHFLNKITAHISQRVKNSCTLRKVAPSRINFEIETTTTTTVCRHPTGHVYTVNQLPKGEQAVRVCLDRVANEQQSTPSDHTNTISCKTLISSRLQHKPPGARSESYTIEYSLRTTPQALKLEHNLFKQAPQAPLHSIVCRIFKHLFVFQIFHIRKSSLLYEM